MKLSKQSTSSKEILSLPCAEYVISQLSHCPEFHTMIINQFSNPCSYITVQEAESDSKSDKEENNIGLNVSYIGSSGNYYCPDFLYKPILMEIDGRWHI